MFVSTKMISSPLKYVGSKHGMMPTITSLFPPHDLYLETHGGGGAILFNKKPSRIEIYNDINSDLTTFFRVLRDNPVELRELCLLTPNSLEEHNLCKHTMGDESLSDLERARRVFTAYVHGHAGKYLGGFGRHREGSIARAVSMRAGKLLEAAERLMGVTLENEDAPKILDFYCGRKSDSLAYCDPPYLFETRHNYDGENLAEDKVPGRYRIYKNEYTIKDHVRLMETIIGLPGMVVISGYLSEMYCDYLSRWKLVSEIKKVFTSNAKPGDKRREVVECVWINELCEIRLKENGMLLTGTN